MNWSSLRFLCALSLVVLSSLAFVSNAHSQQIGDADGDGFVTIVDALQVARYDAKLIFENNPNFYLSAADADCSGSVNIVDALQIARYDARMITEFCV